MTWLAEILFIGAAICKAVADTCDHHINTSIFRNLNPKFWDRSISSDHAKKIFGWKFDSWHLFNSLMIILMAAAAITHQKKLDWYWELLIAGGLWNFWFNIFYNKVLR